MKIQSILGEVSSHIYLDYNASTPVLPSVLEAMEPFLSKIFYNMSNPYSYKIKDYIDSKRENILEYFGAKKGKIVFYGGATEAINAAISGVALDYLYKNKLAKHIIVSSIEHDAVIICADNLKRLGFIVSICPVNEKGLVDIEVLKNLLQEDTILVSIMHVNNETGVIQPIEEIGKLCKSNGIIFHSDGVSAVGRLDISKVADYVDIYTISANKFYGPKGIALNYISEEIETIQPIIYGSDQEYNLRAGTQNLPNIIGMSEALDITLRDYEQVNKNEKLLVTLLREILECNVPFIRINGDQKNKIDNTLNVSFKNLNRKDIFNFFLNSNLLVNIGATYLDDKSSHVIKAMYDDKDYISGSIRFSVGRFTTEQDIKDASKIIENIDKFL